MRVEIHKSVAHGSAQVPPSKSMAHRYLIAAALAEGKSEICGIEYSQDILATIDCLQALGVKIECNGDRVTVYGTGNFKPQNELNCRESGSTLRFLLPLCLLSGQSATLLGSERLMERPLSVYETLCNKSGFSFVRNGQSVCVCGVLQSGDYVVDASVSSQFISGLIFALLKCKGKSTIHLSGKIESRSYIDLTVDALRCFGFQAQWSASDCLELLGGKGTPQTIAVEGDYSNAAFLDALNLLGGSVPLVGLKENSLQGDQVYRVYFERIKKGNPTLSLADCPDLAPILMAMAAAFQGARFTDTARLQIKESDRGSAMAQELQKCGVQVDLHENEIIVYGGTLMAPKEILFGHNDHRIVMAMAVLCTKIGGMIDGAQAVSKSYPRFFEQLAELGIEVDLFEIE